MRKNKKIDEKINIKPKTSDLTCFYNKPYQEKSSFSKPHVGGKNDQIKILNHKLKRYKKGRSQAKWEKAQNILILQKIGSFLGMTGIGQKTFVGEYAYDRGDWMEYFSVGGSQIDRAKILLDNLDLRKIHRGGPGRKLDREIVIAAIAMYVMRLDNPLRSDCRYSTEKIKKLGVTKKIYDVVAKNIAKASKEDPLIMGTIRQREVKKGE